MAALMPKGCQKRENLNIFNIELTLPKLYTRVRFPPPAPPNLRPFLALKALPNCRRARPRHSLRRCNDCAYMNGPRPDVAQGRASIRTGAAREENHGDHSSSPRLHGSVRARCGGPVAEPWIACAIERRGVGLRGGRSPDKGHARCGSGSIGRPYLRSAE